MCDLTAWHNWNNYIQEMGEKKSMYIHCKHREVVLIRYIT